MHQGEARWGFDDTQRRGKAPLIGGEGGATLRLKERHGGASTAPVPLFTLFALKVSLDFKATNPNNVKGGTCLADAE